MKTFFSFVTRISTWTGQVISWLTILVIATVIYEVVMRYVFTAPTRWAAETLGFLCALIYVLGGAWVFVENRHVKVEFVYERLTPRQRAGLDAATYFLFALYIVFMIWATGRFAWESILLGEGSGSPWNPPVYPIKIALFIGVVLVFLQGSANLVRNLHYALTGKEL